MNTLGRLDAYVFTLLSRRSASPSSSLSPSRQYTRPLTPTLEKDALSIPPPSARLSNLPPTPRKRRLGRRKPTTSNIKVPPPTTPFLLRIILALWSILLSFWRSLVGETRAERGKKRRKRTLSTISQVLNPVDHDVEIEGEGSASEAEGVIISDDEGWTDPVTRAPVDKKLDVPSDDEFSASSMYSQDGKNREVSVPRDDLTPSKRAVEPGFTFRLRSAEKRNSLLSLDTNSQSLVEEKDAATLAQTPIKSSQPYKPSPSPTSILSNPIPSIVTHDANNTTPPGKATRQNRLLPNPMSTSLLDPSVPATPASRTFAAAISNSSSGRSLAAPPRLHHTPFHLRKTLILDLDETLIHSTSRPLSYAASAGGGLLGLSFGGLLGGRGKRREGHTVEVVIGGRSTTYHVYKRPYVDHFLKKVASWYTLVIFTASMPEYADPVIDWLDGGRGLFAKRLYRESCCYQPYGSYVKDLALVEADLSRVCFMDNSPVSYMWNKANALPIEGWTHDPNDEALLHCIPVLDSLRFVNDVRRILGIRGFS